MNGPAALLLLLGLLGLAAAQDSIRCYGVNGRAYSNQTKCEGSNACCGVGATCLPNRLCKNPTDNDFTFVRGPCLSNPWDEGCARICVYNETVENNFFPRVTFCGNGSMCCSNDARCCAEGKGRWLDAQGNVFTTPPASTVASTTTTTTALSPGTSQPTATSTSTQTAEQISSGQQSGSETLAFTAKSTSTQTAEQISSGQQSGSETLAFTATSTSTQTAEQSSSGQQSGSETLAFKVGLGAGIPLAALVAGLATWCFIKQRQKKNRHDGAAAYGSENEAISLHQQQSRHPQLVAEAPSSQSPYYDSYNAQKPPGGWAGYPKELVAQSLPQELGTDAQPRELPGEFPGSGVAHPR